LRRNGLSSSVKNVMASPDLPALPDRPVYNKRRDLESYCQHCVQAWTPNIFLTYPVNIGRGRLWKIVVDYTVDTFEIHSTGKDLRCY
jgi:hypothetical protein